MPSFRHFHHGEEGDKGFVLWEVDASVTRFEPVATLALRTVDLFFEGKPDLQRIRAAVREQGLDGAHVRVRWVVADEDRHESIGEQATGLPPDGHHLARAHSALSGRQSDHVL